MTSRITIKTAAYSRNPHYAEIISTLRGEGHKAGTNVAIDGQVSIDTDAPADVVERVAAGRPKTVRVTHY